MITGIEWYCFRKWLLEQGGKQYHEREKFAMRKKCSIFFLFFIVLALCCAYCFGNTAEARSKRRTGKHHKMVKASVSRKRLKVGKRMKIHTEMKHVRYSSSDSNIASVNKKGIITGKRTGKVRISVKRSGYQSKQISLRIQAVSGKPDLTVACDEVKLQGIKMKKIDEQNYQYSAIVHNTAKRGKVYQISYYYRIEVQDPESKENGELSPDGTTQVYFQDQDQDSASVPRASPVCGQGGTPDPMTSPVCGRDRTPIPETFSGQNSRAALKTSSGDSLGSTVPPKTSPGCSQGSTATPETFPGCSQSSTAAPKVSPGCSQDSTAAPKVSPGCSQGSAAAPETSPGCSQGSTAAPEISLGQNQGSTAAPDAPREYDSTSIPTKEKTVILTAKNIRAGKKSSRIYCEGDISGKISSMNLFKIKLYTKDAVYTYHVDQNKGHIKWSGKDRTGPVIKGWVGKNSYYQGEPLWVCYSDQKERYHFKEHVQAVDARDGKVPITVDTSQINWKKEGIYKVYYTAEDRSGNRSKAWAKVQVYQPGEAERIADIILKTRIKSGSDIQKLRRIYQYVKGNCSYVGSGMHTNWRYAAVKGIRGHRGDCFTYYSISKLLMLRSGIPHIMIRRYPAHPGHNHWWNLVYVGGGWYHFDATPRARRGYFCLQTDAQLRMYDTGPTFRFRKELYPKRATKRISRNPI